MFERTKPLFLLLFLAGMLFSWPHTGFAADKRQTIPTRTPTPSATDTPTSGGGDPTSPPPPTGAPSATSTDAPDTPEPTATTVPVTIAATPEGGFWPTAAPCSPAPTVQAFGRVNARSGPGLGYTLLAQLSYLEVRPITGRAQFANWWQIELVDGTLGWVSDEFVQVNGYTGQVPILPAPTLPDGSTPVPGSQWDPTPNPICTPPPTFTATPSTTPTSSQTPSPETTSTATISGSPTVATEDNVGRAEPSAIPLDSEPAGTEADVATIQEPPAAIPVAPTAVEEINLIAGEAAPTEAASNENAEPAPGALMGWLLPIAAIALVAVGVALLIFRR